MTVIAYRNKVLAADSCISQGTFITGSATKIARTPAGWLVGAAGDATDMRRFMNWAQTDFDLAARPHQDKPDLQAIAISPAGTVFFYEDSWDGFIGEGPYHAIGSGGDAAMIAMDMGATAERACLAACKRIHGCAPPIVKLKLK